MINLIEWQESLNKAFEEGKTCILASAGADGHPDLAFKGSMMIFDEENLAWWERSLAEQIADIKENPNVVVLYYNRDLRLNLRFYGVATLHEDGAMRKAIREKVIDAEKARTPNEEGFAVSVRVDRVRAGSNVVQEREGA